VQPVAATEWFIADTHFGDKAVLTPGKNPRPFPSLQAMADEIVKNWRELVKPTDVVWMIGDCGKDVEVFRDLPGRKRLVGGNWDKDMVAGRYDMFEEVHGCVYLKGLVLTHIPVHPCQVGDWIANVHGHLHGKTISHDRYVSVCVDQTQWRPVSREKVNWALRVSHLRRYPLPLPKARRVAA
jgi:calcineurin-like phosphoesterase family protein